MSEWRERLADGIHLAFARLPFVVITKKRLHDQERNACEIGRDVGAERGPTPPRRAPR